MNDETMNDKTMNDKPINNTAVSRETADVVDVDIQRTEKVVITFDDDVVCTFGVAELRAACPCATCRGFRDRGQLAWPRPGQSDTIAIRDAEFSGAWGISITWTDGHDTGIYAWANLRRWWLTGFRDAIEDMPL